MESKTTHKDAEEEVGMRFTVLEASTCQTCRFSGLGETRLRVPLLCDSDLDLPQTCDESTNFQRTGHPQLST